MKCEFYNLTAESGDNYLANERFWKYMTKRMIRMHKLGNIRRLKLKTNEKQEITLDIKLEDGYIHIKSCPANHCYLFEIKSDREEYEKVKAYLNKFMPYEEKLSLERRDYDHIKVSN